jgi:hypothetical protein
LPPTSAVGFLHIPRRRGPEGTDLAHLIRATEIALEFLVRYSGDNPKTVQYRGYDFPKTVR